MIKADEHETTNGAAVMEYVTRKSEEPKPHVHATEEEMLLTTMSVLDGFGAYPAVIDRELRRYLPFLATTKLLVAAVKAGQGREVAHELIKKHAVAVALDQRERGVDGNDLTRRLGEDPAFPLSQASLDALLTHPLDFVGDARRQVRAIARRIDEIVAAHPDDATYTPEPIL